MATFDASRRNILRVSTLAAAAAAVAKPAFADQPKGSTADRSGPEPTDLNRKFFPDGRVRKFAGNTIICHLPQQGQGFATFDALLDVYRSLPAYGFSKKLAILPTSSYHMTVFSGADDESRGGAQWPSDLPRDTSMQRCNEILARRLEGFKLESALPIRMKIGEAPEKPELIMLRLIPADEDENRKLRRIRDRLADALKIRAPNHDAYLFHTTIAYQIDWLTPSELREYEVAHASWVADIKNRAAIIEFGAPEYCTFEDMFAYRRLFQFA